MQAITQKSYGAPIEVLKLEEAPKPTVTDDTVLIRVHAAAVNKGDWHLTTGTPYIVRLMFGLRRPKNPIGGQEMAGTVEAVGKNVTQFQPGDAVFGELPGGAFAEYVCAPESKIVRMPSNLTFAQAAAAPWAITALHGLRDCAKLKPGQHALINGAGGGVGTYAVQFAKLFGATVTAVCSASKAEVVRSLGADHLIDYTREDFAEGGQRFDVLFDLVGNRSLRQYRRAVKRGGVYVAVAGGNGKWLAPLPRIFWMKLTAPFVSQRMSAALPPSNLKPFLVDLLGPLERGEIVPVIGLRCPLSEVPDALNRQGQGHTFGKTVVTIFGADETPTTRPA